MRYFDCNASAPLHPKAREVWLDASEKWFANPSSLHRLGARAERALGAAREKLAAIVGCVPEEIVWTSGATESNNAVLHHVAQVADSAAEIWISAIEHPCVIEAANRWVPERCRQIPVDRDGVIDLAWIERRLRETRPALVAVMAANNETGVLQPWRAISEACKTFDLPFFCDAAQWVGRIAGKGLGACDFLSGSAHKFGGPRGAGFLKCPLQFQPLLLGGPQEGGRRAGTENLPGVLAMLAALEAREASLANHGEERAARWRAEFEDRMLRELPGVEIVGAGVERLWNTVLALMPEVDCPQRWLVKLDKLGFAVSNGSACASGKEVPSHVLRAIGYPPAQASRALRISAGWETTEEDWLAISAALRAAFKELSAPD